MTRDRLVVVADSLGQQVVGSIAIAQGGRGGAFELVAERLANIAGVGPLLSSGKRGVAWLNGNANNVNYWEFTTGADAWTAVADTDPWDVLPYGKGQVANGINKIGTTTLPTPYRTADYGYRLTFVDYANGGNFQISTAGGAWFAHGVPLDHDNSIKHVDIATPVTPGQTVRVRGYNGSGDCGAFPADIEWYYEDPGLADGIIVDNLAWGGQKLHELVRVTSGNRLALISDAAPNLGTVMLHINDVALADEDGWEADLITWEAFADQFGPVGLISPHECNTTAYNQTQQTNYRAQTATTGASLGAKVLDIYNAWAAKGITGNAASVAAGLVTIGTGSDYTHQTQAGALDYAERLYWFIRNQILGIGAGPSSYPVSAKQAAKQYSGKLAAVQYSAGAPISIA